jgi:hypothetical protein
MPTALETAIQTEIAKLTAGSIARCLAEEKLAEYVAARAALSASAGSDLITYSRAGFSATKMTPRDFRLYVQEIESELRQILYGTTSLVDGSAFPEGGAL